MLLAHLLRGSFAAAGAHQITMEVCGQNSLYFLEYQPHQNVSGDLLLLLLPHETPMDSRLQAALKSPRSSFAAKLNVLSRAPFFLFLRRRSMSLRPRRCCSSSFRIERLLRSCVRNLVCELHPEMVAIAAQCTIMEQVLWSVIDAACSWRWHCLKLPLMARGRGPRELH